MWDLHPLELLLALALDFALGKPRWMPDLPALARSLTGRPADGGLPLPVSLLLAAGLLAAYLVLAWFLPPVLRSLLEIFVIYQAVSSATFTRTIKDALQHLLRDQPNEARAALQRVPALAHLPENAAPGSLSQRLVIEVGESIGPGLVAPLFWAALLGPPGALLYRLLAAIDPPKQESAPPGTTLHTVIDWLPVRLVAVLSETFRNYRSLGAVMREARQMPGTNRGWGAAAIARDLQVRLEMDPPPGDGESAAPPTVFHPEGQPAGPPHLAEALSWHWRITAFSVVLALLASY